MLFGHQNDSGNGPQAYQSNDQPADDSAGVNPLAVDAQTGASLPTAPVQEETETAQTFVPSAPEPVAEPDHTEQPAPEAAAPVPADQNELLSLKQQALEQLSPLVDHLEQSPEEKFRTTMMMIQSSDNQALIKEAYEAAQAINDNKVRAQALLDIVNEINYFTQHDA